MHRGGALVTFFRNVQGQLAAPVIVAFRCNRKTRSNRNHHRDVSLAIWHFHLTILSVTNSIVYLGFFALI